VLLSSDFSDVHPINISTKEDLLRAVMLLEHKQFISPTIATHAPHFYKFINQRLLTEQIDEQIQKVIETQKDADFKRLDALCKLMYDTYAYGSRSEMEIYADFKNSMVTHNHLFPSKSNEYVHIRAAAGLPSPENWFSKLIHGRL
jgi:hypothetical protein